MNLVMVTINVIDGAVIDQSGLETGPKEVSNYTSIIDLLANLLLLHFPCFPPLQKSLYSNLARGPEASDLRIWHIFSEKYNVPSMNYLIFLCVV